MVLSGRLSRQVVIFSYYHLDLKLKRDSRGVVNSGLTSTHLKYCDLHIANSQTAGLQLQWFVNILPQWVSQ